MAVSCLQSPIAIHVCKTQFEASTNELHSLLNDTIRKESTHRR